MAGPGTWKGVTCRSELEEGHAIIVWERAREMARSAELDLRERACRLPGLPFRALTIISVLHLFVGLLNRPSLPLACQLREGGNSVSSLTTTAQLLAGVQRVLKK